MWIGRVLAYTNRTQAFILSPTGSPQPLMSLEKTGNVALCASPPGAMAYLSLEAGSPLLLTRPVAILEHETVASLHPRDHGSNNVNNFVGNGANFMGLPADSLSVWDAAKFADIALGADARVNPSFEEVLAELGVTSG